MVAVLEVVDRAGVGEEGLAIVRQAAMNVLRKLAFDAPYLRTVRVVAVKSVCEELKSRGMRLETPLTENIKGIVNPYDPRVIEILIPSSV